MSPTTDKHPHEYVYDVALSFASEQRSYAEGVATGCRENGIRVFYDNFEKAELWGKDLYQHLDWVYSMAARYCVIFVSAAYVKKAWSTHEQRSAQERAFHENAEYILPVIFDDTRAPGIPSTIGHLDARLTTPDDIVRLIEQKLRGKPRTETAHPATLTPSHEAAPMVSNHISGTVTGEVIQARDIIADKGIHIGSRMPPPSTRP